MSPSFNTLIISDLHLGEDLSPSANEATARHIDLVERQLVAFFQHYAHRRDDGLAWRVVVNGDMIDFMSITILPDRPELARLDADRGEDDHVFGLRRTVNATIAKVKMVAERHAGVFAAMARFVARGNRIEIVCGNHDIEFHWPDVQAAFCDAVAAAYRTLPEAARPGAPDAHALASGIGFHPWFFHEPGVAWIEHGHQYDENCAFVYGLNPLHPTRDEILANVDTASTRYLTNYVREIDAHAQEDWSAMGYVRFAMSLGLRGTLRTARAYYNFAASLLSVRKAAMSHKARRLRQSLHGERLARLSRTWNLDPSLLVKLDALRKRPIVSSMRRLMRVLMLDKVFVCGVAVLAMVAAIWLIGGWAAALACVGIAFFASLVAWLFDRGRNVDPAAPLMTVPARILECVDAEYCIFGHTHKPIRMALEGGGVYFNTGTWLPSGKPGLLRAFTHVVIRHGAAGARAELCQWRDGASRAFTAGGVPAGHQLGERGRKSIAAAATSKVMAQESPAASTELPR